MRFLFSNIIEKFPRSHLSRSIGFNDIYPFLAVSVANFPSRTNNSFARSVLLSLTCIKLYTLFPFHFRIRTIPLSFPPNLPLHSLFLLSLQKKPHFPRKRVKSAFSPLPHFLRGLTFPFCARIGKIKLTSNGNVPPPTHTHGLTRLLLGIPLTLRQPLYPCLFLLLCAPKLKRKRGDFERQGEREFRTRGGGVGQGRSGGAWNALFIKFYEKRKNSEEKKYILKNATKCIYHMEQNPRKRRVRVVHGQGVLGKYRVCTHLEFFFLSLLHPIQDHFNTNQPNFSSPTLFTNRIYL